MERNFNGTLDPVAAKSQAGMRKTLSNPFLLLIGISYTLFFVGCFSDLILNLENLGAAMGSMPTIINVLMSANVFANIVYPALLAVAFFLLYANSKNYSQPMLRKSGTNTLFAGNILVTAYYCTFIAADFCVWMIYANNGFIGGAYSIWRVAYYMLMTVYALSFFAFAESMLENSLSSATFTSRGSVLFGISNVINALLILIGMFIKEMATGQIINSDDNLSQYIALLVYGFMAVFAFYYKTMIANVNSEITAVQKEYGNDSRKASQNSYSTVAHRNI